jgi:hypothetical protein
MPMWFVRWIVKSSIVGIRVRDQTEGLPIGGPLRSASINEEAA